MCRTQQLIAGSLAYEAYLLLTELRRKVAVTHYWFITAGFKLDKNSAEVVISPALGEITMAFNVGQANWVIYHA